jgi:glutathione reductase (NADPH)
MATKKFDLVVIGTGSASSAVAMPCRAAGWQVAVIDSRPFGGTCALRGCDPKKVLVGAAEIVDWATRMQGKGVGGVGRGPLQIDWRELMRFKRTFTDPVPRRREESLTKAGIAAFHGRARFVAPTAIQIGEDRLEGRYIVIATGAHPARLNIPGEDHLTISDQFLELDALPPRIIFVGGGYIAFEFAHVATRAGAQVTILHRGPRPLERFDPDLVGRLVQRTRELGVEIHLKTEVTGIEQSGKGLKVSTSADGRMVGFEADLVVHAAGRVPEIEDLNVEAANIQADHSGVRVNEFLQSLSNPAIYAAGDAAAGGPPLTPVSSYEGEVVAENLLNGNRRRVNYAGVPSVVFTIPPLASVGLSEAQVREQGLQFRTNSQDTAGWYSSRRIGERYSGFKVLLEEATGKVVGAHLLGPHAEEVINLFALAIRHGLTASQLTDTMYAYPTHASDISYMLE